MVTNRWDEQTTYRDTRKSPKIANYIHPWRTLFENEIPPVYSTICGARIPQKKAATTAPDISDVCIISVWSLAAINVFSSKLETSLFTNGLRGL